jgi:hypothetical protein
MIGMSNKITEFEIKGANTTCDEGASMSESGSRLWSVVDAMGATLFEIPYTSLVYCIVDASKHKKRHPRKLTNVSVIRNIV